MGTSSGRFNFSLLVGVRFGLRMDSRVSPKETSLQGRPSIVRGLGGEATTLQPIPTFLNFFLSPCSAPASSAGRFLLQRESYWELFSVNLHPHFLTNTCWYSIDTVLKEHETMKEINMELMLEKKYRICMYPCFLLPTFFLVSNISSSIHGKVL